MSTASESPLTLPEGRFARLEAIEWWNQSRLRDARILVVGAGALGNEIVKNLALLGVGHVILVDMDRVELSNLSRAVLLREADEGHPKAQCCARAARSIYPDMDVTALHGNVMADVGLGVFRWAEVVLGALDNREARVFVNAACARLGRPWIDGGIDVLQGIARVFAPPATACYECTMSRTDWDLLNKRRSCSLLARRAALHRGTPTTSTTASVIGAIQVQEAVKLLHGLDTLAGRAFVFEGARHSSYTVEYPIHPDCPHHDPPAPVEPVAEFTSGTPLRAVAQWAARRLGGLDALDLSRELVQSLRCAACGKSTPVWRPIDHIPEEEARCPSCRGDCSPDYCHSLPAGSDLLARSPRALGLPARDILWARRATTFLGIEMAGDPLIRP